MTKSRWVALAVVVLALLFAVAGGEYSTWDWWTLRRAEREERARIAALTAAVDSLDREVRAVETDPAVQEQIARERFGMLRRGEFAYLFVPAREP